MLGHRAVLLTAPTAEPCLPSATPLEPTLMGMLQVFSNTYEKRRRKGRKRARFAQSWCNISPFRINTSKSVSKQTTLTPFRMNTYEKTGGWGGSSQTVNNPRAPRLRVIFLSSLPRYLLTSLPLGAHRRTSPPCKTIPQSQRRPGRRSRNGHRRDRFRPAHPRLRQSSLLHHLADSSPSLQFRRVHRRNSHRHSDRSDAPPRRPARHARLRLSFRRHSVLHAPRICLRNSARRIQSCAGSYFRPRHASPPRRTRKALPRLQRSNYRHAGEFIPRCRNSFSGFCEIMFLEEAQNSGQQSAVSRQARQRPRSPGLAKSPPRRPCRATLGFPTRRSSCSIGRYAMNVRSLNIFCGWLTRLAGCHPERSEGSASSEAAKVTTGFWHPDSSSSGENFGFFFYRRDEPVRIVAHNS